MFHLLLSAPGAGGWLKVVLQLWGDGVFWLEPLNAQVRVQAKLLWWDLLLVLCTLC